MSDSKKEGSKIASPNRSTRLSPEDEERLVFLMTKLYPGKIDRKKGKTHISVYKCIDLAVQHVLKCSEVRNVALLSQVAEQRQNELNIAKLAALSGISKRTLQRKAKADKIIHRKNGRDYIFNLTDVVHLLPSVTVLRTD